MKTSRAFLYLVSFAGLAGTAALAVDRMGRSSVAPVLVWTVIAATVAGAPGLVRRRAWPLALVLLPLGAAVVLRLQMPVPADVDGIGRQAAFYLEQLRSGAQVYAARGFPLDVAVAGDLKLLISLALYAVVGLAAFLALSLRSPVPAVAVLVIPLGFGVTVDREPRALGLTLAFLALSACVLLLSRALERRSWRASDTAAGMGTAAAAACLALWLVGTTSVAASQPWQDWRTWDLAGVGEARFGFDSMEGYAGLLDPENNELVMSVESPIAAYWRANALEGFDGIAWFGGSTERNRLEVTEQAGAFTYTVPVLGLVPPGTRVRQSFSLKSMQSDYFFTGGTAKSLTYGRDVPVHARRTYALTAGRPLGPGTEYTVTAVVPDLTPADLVGRGRDYPQQARRRAGLPFPTPADGGSTATEAGWRRAMASAPHHDEWLGLYRLNRDIVGDAVDPYEIALRVENYLRLNYTYTLTASTPAGRSPYAAFLLETGRGFCQHFAGAMAVLLRFNGVPARVAVGFAPGIRVGEDTFMVGRNDAHAWVEVYFPRVGWVPFEPTPGQTVPGSGASSTSPAFADPFAAHAAATADVMAPVTEAPRGLQEDSSGDGSDAAVATPGASAPRGGWLPWALAATAVCAAVAWPLGRALGRRRALRRGDPESRLRAALAALRADLADFGFPVPPSQTLEETAAMIARRFGLDAAVLVERSQAVLFGGRAATEEDLAAIAGFRRELHRRLRADSGRRGTLFAAYGLGARRTPRTRRLRPRSNP